MDAPCPVCRQTRFEVWRTVRDTNQDVAGRWTVLRCSDCGLGRLDPFPSEEDVAGFYRDVFYTGDGERFSPAIEGLRQAIAGLRGWTIRRLHKGAGRVLDFGAGSGHFVAAMRRVGWDATPFDPYSGSRAGDGRAMTLANEDFDVVTLWYVFEHLRNPREFLAEARRVLRPGGLLVLAQQDFSSVQARLFGSRWQFLDPPRHLFHFDPVNLARLARECGFAVATVEHASLEMGPYCILQSLLNVLTGNENYLFKFLKNRGLGAAGRGHTPRGRFALGAAASLVLLPVLAPLSLLMYGVLLMVGSGDVFSLYLRKI